MCYWHSTAEHHHVVSYYRNISCNNVSIKSKLLPIAQMISALECEANGLRSIRSYGELIKVHSVDQQHGLARWEV